MAESCRSLLGCWSMVRVGPLAETVLLLLLLLLQFAMTLSESGRSAGHLSPLADQQRLRLKCLPSVRLVDLTGL